MDEGVKPAPVPAGPEGAGTAGAEHGLPAAQELYDQLLRLKAEFENYRKRIDREKPEWVRLGETRLWGRLLPVYDVLLAAHEQVLRWNVGEGGANKELAQGLELIFKEFNKIFETEGVDIIETVGKPYDPDLHEVLGAVETDGRPEGAVVEELQRGYTLRGKVLRPAKVRIAKRAIREEKT